MSRRSSSSANAFWIDLVDQSLPPTLRQGDPDEVRRARATIASCAVGTLAFLVTALIRISLEQWVESLALVAMALMTWLLPVLLRRTASLRLVGNLLALIVFAATMSTTVVTGGGYAGPLFAVAIAPMVAVLFAGPLWGVLWAFTTCGVLAWTASRVASGADFVYVPNDELIEVGKFQVAIVFVLVTFVAMVLYEWLKNAALHDLARSEGRYRALVESSPLGVVGWGRDGQVSTVNDKVLEMLGAPLDDARPQRFNMLTDPVLESAGVARLARRCLDEEHPVSGEANFTSAWGREVEIRVRMAPLYDLEGEVRGAEAIVEDVTEERHAERESRRLDEQLAHTQKLKSIGVLAGGIAHDFNNLLTVILGNAGLLLRQIDSEDPSRRKLLQIESSAKHAARLTQQMLAYAGKGQFVKETVQLSELVENLGELIQASTPRRVAMTRDLDTELPLIRADVEKLRQVVMNLITNAVEAVSDPAGGTVAIRTWGLQIEAGEEVGSYLTDALEPGSYVCLEVTDDGVGMDADTQRKIFDPFFTTKFLGRGLGLSSLLGIVRGHGGGIQIESEMNRGTTFRVYFPVGEDLPAEEITPDMVVRMPGEESLRGKTVLVADDESAVLDTVEAMLTSEGICVLTSRDGREAVTAFEAHADEIAAVLLDVSMPVMDGPRASREIRSIRPDVPVIFASGYGEESVAEAVEGDARVTFVAKPYQSRALLDALAKVLSA